MMAPPFFRSFLARVLVGGLSGAALIACTSALGNFTIDDSLANDGGKDSSPGSTDGAANVDGGGATGKDGAVFEGGVRAPCTANGRFVFVTAEPSPNGNLGGLAGAHAKCADNAQAGGLPGTYAAWLSTTVPNNSPGDILTSPMFLPDCTVVIKNPGQYKGSQGQLDHQIDQDQFGKTIGQVAVWTATRWDGVAAAGTALDTTCVNWSDPGTVMQSKGAVGDTAASDDKWSLSSSQSCGSHAHLYCVQVK